MGFFRQEYQSELPCPLPGDLPDPGIEPMSLKCPALAGEFFTSSATWEAHITVILNSPTNTRCVYVLQRFLNMVRYTNLKHKIATIITSANWDS